MEPTPNDDAGAAGFVSLFNGKDFSGWMGDSNGQCQWTVEDGNITAEGGPQNCRLLSRQTYSRFVLRLQFLVDEGTTGAVDLWATDNEASLWVFLDRTRSAMGAVTIRDHGESGYNVHRIRPNPEIRPEGVWNDMEIEMEEEFLRVSLNGRQLGKERIKSMLAGRKLSAGLQNQMGRIGLERSWGTGFVRFRNVRVKPLSISH